MPKELQRIDDTHSIYQFSEGFSFGTDAVLLAGFIRCKKGQTGVEFGTGTGIIPLLLSLHKEFDHIFALEIQKEYAALAQENLQRNGCAEKVTVIEGDLRDQNPLPEKIDFVFTNPPYMKADCGYLNENEKKRIARHELFGNIEEICLAAARLLQDKGEFWCVYRTERLCDLFCAMRAVGLEPKNLVPVAPKAGKATALVLVRGVKGAKSGLKVREAFVLQNDAGEKSPESRLLYEKGQIDYEI